MLSEIYQSVLTCFPGIITNVLPRFLFLDVEPAKYMVLKQRVKDNIQELTHLIKSSLGSVESRMPFAGLFDTLSGLFGFGDKGHNEIVKRLVEFGCSTEQVVNSILALLVGATVEMSLGMSLLLPFMEKSLSMGLS
jgi:linoleate 10R-lipoxygenase